MSNGNDESPTAEPSAAATSPSPLEEQLKEAALKLLHSHHRCNDEAEVCRKKAARLRHEANEEDACAKRFRSDANEALGVHHALQFEALCLALQRNDAVTTNLANSIDYPVAYALRLGQALRNNTRVSALSINVANLVPASFDAHQAWSAIGPLLEHIRGSRTTRAVSISHEHPNDVLNEFLVMRVMDASLSQRAQIEDLTSKCTVSILPFCQKLPFSGIKKLDIYLNCWTRESCRSG
jgi:hypothetical protein